MYFNLNNVYDENVELKSVLKTLNSISVVAVVETHDGPEDSYPLFSLNPSCGDWSVFLMHIV